MKVIFHDDFYQVYADDPAAARNKSGCFAVLEGGYNHDIPGRNVLALIQGMSAA